MAHRVFDMAFAKVFPCLIAKAERWTIEKITGKRI